MVRWKLQQMLCWKNNFLNCGTLTVIIGLLHHFLLFVQVSRGHSRTSMSWQRASTSQKESTFLVLISKLNISSSLRRVLRSWSWLCLIPALLISVFQCTWTLFAFTFTLFCLLFHRLDLTWQEVTSLVMCRRIPLLCTELWCLQRSRGLSSTLPTREITPFRSVLSYSYSCGPCE